jgi:SAM-dependent methyltransferase
VAVNILKITLMEKIGEKMKEVYLNALLKHGPTQKALGCIKNRQSYRFSALCNYLEDNSSVLDYGCGFGDLKSFITQNNFSNIEYSGLDLVSEFVEIATKNHPGVSFKLHEVQEPVIDKYDFIVCSGVFNFKYLDDDMAHSKLVFDRIKNLFNCTNNVLSIDFQSNFVDFKQPSSYHQDLSTLASFITNKLGRRFIIDNSYMPYEFTVHIFKKNKIIRPKLVFDV